MRNGRIGFACFAIWYLASVGCDAGTSSQGDSGSWQPEAYRLFVGETMFGYQLVELSSNGEALSAYGPALATEAKGRLRPLANRQASNIALTIGHAQYSLGPDGWVELTDKWGRLAWCPGLECIWIRDESGEPTNRLHALDGSVYYEEPGTADRYDEYVGEISPAGEVFKITTTDSYLIERYDKQGNTSVFFTYDGIATIHDIFDDAVLMHTDIFFWLDLEGRPRLSPWEGLERVRGRYVFSEAERTLFLTRGDLTLEPIVTLPQSEIPRPVQAHRSDVSVWMPPTLCTSKEVCSTWSGSGGNADYPAAYLYTDGSAAAVVSETSWSIRDDWEVIDEVVGDLWIVDPEGRQTTHRLREGSTVEVQYRFCADGSKVVWVEAGVLQTVDTDTGAASTVAAPTGITLRDTSMQIE